MGPQECSTEMHVFGLFRAVRCGTGTCNTKVNLLLLQVYNEMQDCAWQKFLQWQQFSIEIFSAIILLFSLVVVEQLYQLFD